jgi:putative phage-type endonuclease
MIEQGSAEWKALRLGKVTASRVADVVAKTKTGVSAMRGNYAAQLVAERLTGTCQESYVSAAMQHGTDTEAQAKLAYEFHADTDIEAIAFVEHPRIPMAGCSPDGLIGPDGLIEIKCPNTATHIATLLGESVDGKYIKQMQWQMACTGRQWCDFVSFDPRMPPEMQLHVCRVHRDQKHIDELQAAVIDFLAEVAVTVERLRTKYQPAAEAA